MFRNLQLRHRMVKYIHSFLDAHSFIEVETPILIKSTPEGARDYLVPSRIYPGKFYALPQSPQQLKQLLMVAGVERYYQIARCFRDEDLRADRQPEFTQFDMEMSFVTEEDILGLMEEMCLGLANAVRPDMTLKLPMPRLTYAEAMQRFGTDKPDLRFGMEIGDISDIVADSTFSIFSGTVQKGGKVKGIAVPGCGGYNKNQLEELNQMARELGAAGVVPLGLGAEKIDLNDLTIEMVKSVAAKHLSTEQVRQIAERLGASAGDLLLFVAGEEKKILPVLGELRCRMGRRLGLASPCELAFCFVVDFPLFEINKETGRLDASHHPFTSPREEDIPLLDSEPEKAGSRAYDIVLNGYEIASGSIRIHQAALQRKIFRLLGYNDEEVNARFGQLLDAFEYGAPPHGGIAAGIDRLAMIMAGEDSIREVIAFPKNQNAVDVMFDAPASVSKEQLAELHIRLKEKEDTGE
jgi:aspartyl-tRNA synthetase